MNGMDRLQHNALIEIETALTSFPAFEDQKSRPEIVDAWIGRACAAIEHWDRSYVSDFRIHASYLSGDSFIEPAQASSSARLLKRILNQAKHSLRITLQEPISLGISAGSTYEYFEVIRKEVDKASKELFFVDAYLEAEFVERYLPHVQHGVKVRLLTKSKIAQLVPALKAYVGQYGLAVEVREAQSLHDRFLFVDQQLCFISGASFKDGAKSSPATITEIRDAFQVHLALYESMWSSAMAIQI
jgi:hypothetical protein